MYLKRIEIAGFKSFADRTVIDFENSVTAVVGPNGSGKSNITEAIRWVLGEQSAKSLRGGKMPDIIFAGSETRKPLNIAEVTIILDNQDHYLPLDFSEISVTRRYRRTGESDFYINKQSCRLKDIQDLFMDSGLGKESFSIISQGKVEAIFSSKPEDRRGIFEEAAGVLKYKQRKKKAEQKLFETEDNLDRVQDIIYELQDQLLPLQTQSESAKRYLELKEQLTEIDVSAVITEIQETKAQWESNDEQLTQLNEVLFELGTKIQQAEDQLIELRQKRGTADEEIEAGNQEILSLTKALENAEGQRKLFRERSQNTYKSSQEYQENLTALEKQISQLGENISGTREKISEKSETITALEEQICHTEKELEKYQKSSKEILSDLRGQYVELMQAQANTNNDLTHLERQYQQEAAKNKATMEKMAELNGTEADLQNQLEKLTAASTAMQESLEAQRDQYSRKQQELAEVQHHFTAEEQNMYQLMNLVQQVKAKLKSLQDIQENYSGFYQGVRLVLQNRKQLSGIVGAVAELIEVPEKFTIAAETALGASAQHIIVEAEKDGREAITFLKTRKGGRATFLPLTTIKPRSLSAGQKERARAVPGYLGIASEEISYPEKIQHIVENLLGTIIFAENLDSANQIARSIHYQARVVSLEGDVINAGGSMTGGATKRGSQGSYLSQSNELQRLNDEALRLDKQLKDKEKSVQHLREDVSDRTQALESLREKGEDARYQVQELTNQLNNTKEALERAQKELQLFSYESRELQHFIENYETQKKELEARQKEVQTQLAETSQEIELVSQESETIEATRQRLQEESSQLSAKLAVAETERNNLEQHLQGFDLQKREAENRRDSLLAQLESLSSDSSDYELSEENLGQQVSDFKAKLTEIEASVATEKATRQKLQQEVDQLDQELGAWHKEQKTLLSNQTKLEVKKSNGELQLDNALQYLQEEYSLTYEAAVMQFDMTEDLKKAKGEVRALKKEIDELGPVNVNAIEQYAQVEERHDFLVSQRDDLLSAKEQLFETMAEMDEEVKTRFNEVFTAIRGKFKAVFPKMFGGGKAELFLTDPHDLLNTGIEIEAQPPGKKLQSLSLLSGGERALTAIALLFSIIQVRTVPFCVLDEVEAALDEANVTRFGHYLSQFQSDTQFIVVTHRKGTMEAANILYGVTMQESGVSKIVSVRLEEVSEGGSIHASKGKSGTV